MQKVNLLFLGGAMFFGGLVLAGFMFAIGIVIAVAGVATMAYHLIVQRQDPYSLQSLRDFEEKQEVDRIREEMGRVEDDSVLCPGCMEVYHSDLPVCPHCRRPR